MTHATERTDRLYAAARAFVESGFDRAGDTHPETLALAWRAALHAMGHTGEFRVTPTRTFRRCGSLGKAPLMVTMSGRVPPEAQKFALHVTRMFPEYLDKTDEILTERIHQIMQQCTAK